MSRTGRVENLTPEQQDALESLKEAVADVEELSGKDDRYLLRWLRARKFDLAKAEDMLRKHLEVRKKHGLDTILTDYKPNEVLEKYFPGGMMGEDRDGHLVWYDNFNYDFKGLHYSVKMEDIFLCVLYRAELVLKHSKESTAKEQRVTFVIDYEKLSLQRHYYWPGIQMIRKLLTMNEANYPEVVKQAFLINLPSVFPLGFNMMKPVLTEETRSKIFLLGADYKEVLQRYISPEELPVAYGGTRCEPDPYCTKYINPGGDIPEQYYLMNLMETAKEDMEKVTVGRGSTHLIPFQVDKPGTILKWEMMSTSHDIGFGWFYKQENGERELIPVKRRKSHIIPESGAQMCQHTGEYLLKLDNSYSWLRSKEVFYSVKVVPPADSEATDITTPSS